MKKRIPLNRGRVRTILCSLLAFLVLFYAVAGNAFGYAWIKADTTEAGSEQLTESTETDLESLVESTETPPETVAEPPTETSLIGSVEEVEARVKADLAAAGIPYGGPGVTNPAVQTMGTWNSGPIGLPKETESTKTTTTTGEGFVINTYNALTYNGAVFDQRHTESATLTMGADVPYNGWSTHSYTCADALGTHTGYCVQPTATPPANGAYTATRLENGDYDNWLRSILYYGAGGPGYSDSSVGLEHWLVANENQPDLTGYAYPITHMIISYAYDYRAWVAGGKVGEFTTDAFPSAADAAARNAYTIFANAMWDAKGTVPERFEGYLFNEGNTSQPMAYGRLADVGWLYLNKQSSNKDLSDGNSNYSLEGAVYFIYKAASGDADRFRYCFKTDKDGKGWRAEYTTPGQKPEWVSQGNDCPDWITLEPGDYWVQEYYSPSSYHRDTNFYKVTITAGQSTYVSKDGVNNYVTDIPKDDPFTITVQKEGTQTGASLEGAEFTVYFFDTLYDSNGNYAIRQDNASMVDLNTAKKKWTFKTIYESATGKYEASFDDAHLVSGDALYHNGDGFPVVPFGTLIIRETKAPDGYQIEGNTLKGESGSTQTGNYFVAHIIEGGSDATIDIGNVMTVTDKVISGDVAIQKKDAQTTDGKEQGNATLQGAEYSVVYNGSTDGSDPDINVDGTTYKKGQTVKVITTDANGYARTTNCALPSGKYYIYETRSPKGYVLDSATKFNFTIDSEGQLVSFTDDSLGAHGEAVVRGGVKLVKSDAETVTAQGKATLGGAIYQIVNISARAVKVNGTWLENLC